MRFTYDEQARASHILLTNVQDERTIELMTGAVFAFVNEQGELSSIEILNTRHFAAEGFTEDDARRAVEWVREQLATLAAS